MHTGHGRSGKAFPKLGLPPASEIVIASVVSWKQMSMFSQTNVPWHIEQQDLTKKKVPPGAVVKVVDSLPQLVCGWLACLEQLVTVIVGVNLWYRSARCYVSKSIP